MPLFVLLYFSLLCIGLGFRREDYAGRRASGERGTKTTKSALHDESESEGGESASDAEHDSDGEELMSAEQVARLLQEALPALPEEMQGNVPVSVAVPVSAAAGQHLAAAAASASEAMAAAARSDRTLRLSVRHGTGDGASSTAQAPASDPSQWSPADLLRAMATASAGAAGGAGRGAEGERDGQGPGPASKLPSAAASSRRVRFAPDTKPPAPVATAAPSLRPHRPAPPRPSRSGAAAPPAVLAGVRERISTGVPTAEMLEAHMDRRMVSGNQGVTSGSGGERRERPTMGKTLGRQEKPTMGNALSREEKL